MIKFHHKALSAALIAAMTMSLAACGNSNRPESVSGDVEVTTDDNGTTQNNTTEVASDGTSTEETEAPAEGKDIISPEYAAMKLAGLEYGTDYTSLYDKVGKSITIADVTEDPDTGLAYIDVDGEQKELGLDFLTMAMVYNTDPAGDYATSDDVYAAWWKLYITRWNYLLPEIPLYSNEYYDLINAQIEGAEENPTNPFWDVTDALIDWKSTKSGNDIILGETTELSGQFRDSIFGKPSPGSSDQGVDYLINDLRTVARTKDGGYEWNDTVVKDHSEETDAEGNKTVTITIYDDMKMSDGSPITAQNYIAKLLSQYSPVWTQASSQEKSGLSYYGWKDAYQKYTGPDSKEGTKEFAGVHLIDDYTFSITVPADQLPYFYDIINYSLPAVSVELYIGDATIQDDGNGCYLSDDFYKKDGDNYTFAATIKKNFTDTKESTFAEFPYSGPYVVKSFDTATSEAVLERNEYYKGNYEGTQPSIDKIILRKVVPATQLEDFKAGGLDVISNITGGAQTDEAISLADGSNGKYVYTHYSRAGYGKLGFRCDYGPAQFKSVREAIAYCMDRAQFAKDFTGGYGGVVDGPYYTGSWMYQEATKQGMLLNSYATSSDSAIEVLEDDGWVYDAEGNDYVSGVRYKAIPADVISDNDKKYQSVDGTYKTTQVGDYYYMPLVINWYGTADNEFTDLLQTGFKENANVTAAGMAVYNTIGDFQPMLDELQQQAIYGYYSGSPMYDAFNFATGFNSAAYDMSYAMTIDPSMYNDYQNYFIKDYADIYLLK